jgi:Kef-type K+ transport system membrane component KefB
MREMKKLKRPFYVTVVALMAMLILSIILLIYGALNNRPDILLISWISLVSTVVFYYCLHVIMELLRATKNQIKELKRIQSNYYQTK